LTNLAPGKYELEVLGSNHDGRFGTTSADRATSSSTPHVVADHAGRVSA
jgi:hypothetical protein